MGTVPKKNPEKIAWYQTREEDWTTHAVEIGISTTEMTTMSGLISDAADALAAQLAAKAAQKNATVALNEASQKMGDFGADLLKKIRAKAGQVGGDSVYILASVPPPATPGPIGPLGKPSDFNVALTEEGYLDTSWKNTNPAGASGAVYQIWRRTTPTGDFEYLGGVGGKKFTDQTIPAGSSQVTYKIQAVRSTSIGPAATFNVTFGVSGGSATIASVEETTAKIAA
jgi:hypothetical protein